MSFLDYFIEEVDAALGPASGDIIQAIVESYKGTDIPEMFLEEYRVWPDGTTQNAEEPPYLSMSDDYTIVKAVSEQRAYEIVIGT